MTGARLHIAIASRRIPTVCAGSTSVAMVFNVGNALSVVFRTHSSCAASSHPSPTATSKPCKNHKQRNKTMILELPC